MSPDTISRLPGGVTRPSYDRSQPIGIVHFGIGAFHRAHQAHYTDACLEAGERGWMIAGVSLRSSTVARQMNPQGGMYTLTQRSDEEPETQVVGSVREVLVADKDQSVISDNIASPDCHIVSFTVTEKGYCRAADGSLDFDQAKNGFYPLLEKALARRQAAGLPGLTLLSCDNLSGNGKQLGRLMGQWLDKHSPQVATWFREHCTTPDSMVDRIVPASTEQDLAELEERIGLRDEAGIFTESFSQWTIENSFADAHPAWDKFGVQIVPSVEPYETAKLRMLNGAHSLLAYAGLDAGYSFVHEAIADPALRAMTQRLMRDEAAPTINPGKGQDLSAYADELIRRFDNPALQHRLIQIAMDGSQKIGQRWLDTLAIQGKRDNSCPAILTALAHWLRHIRGDIRPVDDPRAQEFENVWKEAGIEGIVKAMFGSDGLLQSQWKPSEDELSTIKHALQAIS
nr:mannitol dehydrogenase family protein [Altericroceibacterium endophyticum]